MNNTKDALIWITNIIIKHGIPFQITGGLACIAYGSSRQLADIDIDIPEEHFEKIKNDVSPFITYGPDHYKSESWDLFLMTLNYHGQEIDLSGAYTTRIYNKRDKNWVKIMTDFSKVSHVDIYGLSLPIIGRQELIAYKKILARPVDLLDVTYLEQDL